MSGGGFGALDTMNKTLKNNRGLLKKINVFERVKNYNTVLKGKHVHISSKKVSEEKLEEIRRRTLKEGQSQLLKQISKMALVFIILAAILFVFISALLNS